jgi:hypothetical protein
MKSTTNRSESLNTAENTQCWEGLPWVHAHHKIPDSFVAANPKQPGRCAVEMVCHACGAAILIIFFVPPGKREPVNANKMFEVRDGFANEHARCRPDPTKDYTVYCPLRRATLSPRVYDFAGTFS